MVTNITPYGKQIKVALIETGKTQSWLVAEVARRTGLYFDARYMHKVLTGQHVPQHIIKAINQILGIEEA